MQYKIFGNPFPAVSLRMNRGESIYTQSGGMSWMTDGFSMETNTHGGLMKGLGRMFSGDSLFMATYTAMQDGQEITMAASMPGEIRALEISPGNTYIAQKGAFLCAQHTVELDAVLTKKLSSGMFGGEGLFLTVLEGPGKVWLQTMTASELANKIIPYIPTSGK